MIALSPAIQLDRHGRFLNEKVQFLVLNQEKDNSEDYSITIPEISVSRFTVDNGGYVYLKEVHLLRLALDALHGETKGKTNTKFAYNIYKTGEEGYSVHTLSVRMVPAIVHPVSADPPIRSAGVTREIHHHHYHNNTVIPHNPTMFSDVGSSADTTFHPGD